MTDGPDDMAKAEGLRRLYHLIPSAERRARDAYQVALREALREGVPPGLIAEVLGVHRETIRRDAMTDEERDEYRRAQLQRRHERQGAA